LAIPKIESPVGPQRVAEQAAVGIDGQYPGKLRILLAHRGEEGRTGGLVCRVEVAGAGQTVVKLGRALNFFVQIA
jgi:hypothetical protein